jgi:hypothetical protein
MLFYGEHQDSSVFSPIIGSIDGITSGQTVRNDKIKQSGAFS